MTRQEAFFEINQTQDEYVSELINLINSPEHAQMKSINFTSATGTGKTKMMSKMINRLPDYYFVITTLSKGQLHIQVRDNLKKDCKQQNFFVYGSADYKINSRLDAESIIKTIPEDTKCIWIRDEGHIRTNRWDELLLNVCYKVINFSATNVYSDIHCNFAHTMMLRTVNQTEGTPGDAISKLLEIKKRHKNVTHYNPCAIFRCVGANESLYHSIVDLCNKNNLRYIDITEESFIMSELCKDDNEYDVIINKFKIVEGIDIRRAHVLYMDNQPGNNATTIQAIGRCRRNALLYRNDLDIFADENKELLEATRECYVYYNVDKMRIDTDADGELYYAFCDHVSCQALKPNTIIAVKNGQLSNGLFVLELENMTGTYRILSDKDTGFNIVSPATHFYDTVSTELKHYIYTSNYKKIHIKDVALLPVFDTRTCFNYSVDGEKDYKHYYRLFDRFFTEKKKCNVSQSVYQLFINNKKQYTEDILLTRGRNSCLDAILEENVHEFDADKLREYISTFRNAHEGKRGFKTFLSFLDDLLQYRATVELCMPDNSYWNDTLQINDLCSEYSLLLIQYFSVKQKEEKFRDDEILAFVKRIMETIAYINALFDKGLSSFQLQKADDKVSRLILRIYNDKLRVRTTFEPISYKPLSTEISYDYMGEIEVVDSNVVDYYSRIEQKLEEALKAIYVSSAIFKSEVVDPLISLLQTTENNLKCNTVDRLWRSYAKLYKELSEDECFLIKNGYQRTYTEIAKEQLEKLSLYKDYRKTVNDKESATIGVDLMHQLRIDDGVIWVESKSVSSKVGNYNKLNSFITKRYSNELERARQQYFSGKNSFNLDTKCNSIIGYCVEYYSKYLLYGKAYLGNCLETARDEYYTEVNDDCVVIRACMLKYREMMIRCFGKSVSKFIKAISMKMLANKQYDYFVSLVKELGTRTADYVKANLYADKEIKDNIDPDLSIRHIAGLADYITEDTILDVKVRNCIDEKSVRQVLAYHYLSTKRTDVNIKRVIVYDAVRDKAVVVRIC